MNKPIMINISYKNDTFYLSSLSMSIIASLLDLSKLSFLDTSLTIAQSQRLMPSCSFSKGCPIALRNFFDTAIAISVDKFVSPSDMPA